jgi:hypothetical protein
LVLADCVVSFNIETVCEFVPLILAGCVVPFKIETVCEFERGKEETLKDITYKKMKIYFLIRFQN